MEKAGLWYPQQQTWRKASASSGRWRFRAGRREEKTPQKCDKVQIQKRGNILRDEREGLGFSRLSTTSVVCGPTKDNGRVNLSGRDERVSRRGEEQVAEGGGKGPQAGFNFASFMPVELESYSGPIFSPKSK